MIGWLRGERIQTWEQGGRHGLVIACGGVGYEVQLTRRDQSSIGGDSCTLWIHQVHREDGSHLYGFPLQTDRDLFRTLIGVNGVGPQVALSLLDSCTAADLVAAIIDGDLKRLTQAQGVGKRTAERIAVELRDRLGAWAPSSEEPSLSLVDRSDVQALPIHPESLQELQLTLETLGYEDLEIRRAMRAVASTTDLPDANDAEGWLRASLRWLSQSA